MQQEELELKQHSSQFAPKMSELAPSFNLDRLKQQQSDNVSIFELSQDELIDKVKHTLAGERYDYSTETWVKDSELEPPMNNKGVHFFMLKFGGHLDKNVTLSNFTLEKIHLLMYEIETAILEIFFKRSKEFDIRQENMDFIKQILTHQIYSNYLRALEGGERTHRETLIKSVESIVDRQSSTESVTPQSNGGLFSFLGKKNHRGGMMNG